MRFGRRLGFLSLLLVGVVAAMIVMNYLIEGFDTCAIHPTSVSAIVTIHGVDTCVTPGLTISNAPASTPIAVAGDSISIQYGGAYNAPISIQYDNGAFTVPIHADGSWPRSDNVQFVVPYGRSVVSITAGDNKPVSGGVLSWLSGLVATPGSGSGSGFGNSYLSSGAVPETNDIIYNQTFETIQDCSTYDDCSC